MERWKELQLEQMSRTTELENAYQIALRFANNIGFKFFAFSTTYQTLNKQLNTVRLNNFPGNWNQEYERQKMSAIDPVVAHCHHSMLPVLWTEELFAQVPALWEAIEMKGFQHGWSQSLRDDETDLCSILSLARSHCPVSALELYENLGFTLFMGRHLHALVAQSLPKSAPPLQLSPREVDVLKLAAAGKTAEESARILNLSSRTIHFHIQSSIEKLKVNNKISAIIAAMKAGFIHSDSTG